MIAAILVLTVSSNLREPTFGDLTLIVPQAVISPKLDGRYTALKELKATNVGNDSSWTNEIDNEWDDAVEIRYEGSNNVFDTHSQSNDEWYARLKHDEKLFYVLVDAVSDHEVGKPTRNQTYPPIPTYGRQKATFLFNTKNVGKSDPKTLGIYYVELFFTSPTRLESGLVSYGGHTSFLDVLPSSYYQYNWSISTSPHSSIPHIVIEVAFDLKLLTRYSRTISCRLGAFDIDLNWLVYENYLDLLGAETIPELKHVANEVQKSRILNYVIIGTVFFAAIMGVYTVLKRIRKPKKNKGFNGSLKKSSGPKASLANLLSNSLTFEISDDGASRWDKPRYILYIQCSCLE